jgi:hypothetical protein
MSDTDSFEEDLDTVSESLKAIHTHMEELSHASKHLYSRALRVQQLMENPSLDLWAESFKLHPRTYMWAKNKMVPRKCSLWLIHQTLLDSAKKDRRIFAGQQVKLTDEEGEIMDLPSGELLSVWRILGRLPRFFLE